jgi:chromosome partitioning protein
MHTLAISNAKGGTGKSTLTVHLAVGLARQGARVLLVDLDVQGNTTEWVLGRRFEADEPGLPDVLERGAIAEAELYAAPGVGGLTVLPSTPAVPSAEFVVANKPAGQAHLRRALAGVKEGFDYALLDCAPNLGLGVVAGLCAADSILVPVVPGFLSLTGIRDLETAVARLREGFNVPAQVKGYLLFATDAREGLSEATRRLLEEKTAGKLLGAQVRISTLAKRLPEMHKTAWDAGCDPRGAEDYPKVLTEVLARIEPAAVGVAS